ncbi:MAG: hypothetical protein R2715_19495 [Ilumatobacteraceae bacterium]
MPWASSTSAIAPVTRSAVAKVDELVQSMSVAARTEHAGDHDLCLRELLAEQSMNGIEPPSA